MFLHWRVILVFKSNSQQVDSFLERLTLTETKSSVESFGSTEFNTFSRYSTTSPFIIGTVSAMLVPTSTGRVAGHIQNQSSNLVYLCFNAGASCVANKGHELEAGGSWVIDKDELYTGAITTISSTGSSNKLYYQFK